MKIFPILLVLSLLAMTLPVATPVAAQEPNYAPVVETGPDATIETGGLFNSSASFTDPDSTSWTATVDYGDGSTIVPLELRPDKTFNLSYVYAMAGSYVITVNVTDDAGAAGSDTAAVTVKDPVVTNAAPVVEAGPDATIGTGETFVSSGNFSDPDSSSWTATVDYGDDYGSGELEYNTDQTFGLRHVYTVAGSYIITVTVTDDQGAAGIDTASVVVNAVPAVYTERTDYSPGDVVNFSALGFWPNEPMHFEAIGSPNGNTLGIDSTTDNNGNCSAFMQLPNDWDQTYVLTATGGNSGLKAQTTFTDAARTASVNGNWNSTATWGGNSVPVAGDTVTINSGITVTVTANAACASISFLSTASSNSNVIINPGVTLTVSGAVTIPRPNTSTNTLAVGAGMLNAGSIAFTSGGGTSRHQVTISTGTAIVTGDITTDNTGASAAIVFSGAGLLKVGGAFLNGTIIGGSLTPSTGTVEYNGNGAQSINDFTYNNLILSGSGSKTLGGAVTVNGNLSIGDGATFTAAGYALTVTGTTTVGGGSSGTLTVSSSTGTKAFNGNIIINNGATWNNTANTALTLPGNLTNNGTFNAGTGVYTLSGSNKTINGTLSIPNITVTGTCTNNGTLTVGTALAGSGTLTNASSGILNINGTSTITTLVASANGNTVNYTDAVQTVKAISYYNLILSGSGAKSITNGTSVAGNLSINGTSTASIAAGQNISVNSLTLGGISESPGTWGSPNSTANYTNDVYFAPTTGYMTVATGPADTTPPTAAITYSPVGPYKAGTNVTITATFNEGMAVSPVPQIDITGANTLPATDMTKTDAKHYFYAYTVGAGDGTATVALSTGTDIAGNPVTSTPTSGASFTVNNTAPTNQDTVFATSVVINGGATVIIVSSGASTNSVWFAPAGTTNFVAGATMTKAANGTSTTILAPTTAGVYYLYLIDSVGNISNASIATLTVDNPTAALTYSLAGPYKAGTNVTITATFSEEVSDSPVTRIAISGANTLAATDMTKTDTTHYTYTYTVGAGNGTATATLSTGISVVGADIISAPTSGATFIVDNTAPTVAITYSVTGPYKAGTNITITSTFSEGMAVSPVPQIAITGANTLAATDMNRTDATHYTYAYTVGAGDGTATVALSTGTDIAGNTVTSAPTSGAPFTVDNTAPINQNTVFASSVIQTVGGSITIVSSGTSTNSVWFAPAGTTNFVAGATMTKAANGTSTTILAPTKAGVYYLYVIDVAGNVSNASIATLTVPLQAGPNDAGTGTGTGWTTPGNITADDTSYATYTIPTSSTSSNLIAAKYGFDSTTVPSGATITGIQVKLGRWSSSTSNTYDAVVQLTKDGIGVGDNKAATSIAWPNSAGSSATYGSPSDTWGTSWAPSDINNDDFGVILAVRNGNTFSTRTATVDYVQITVYYTPPTGTPTTVDLTLSPDSSVSGQTITLTAAVTPGSGSDIPSGTIAFTDGSTDLGSEALNSSGVATHDVLLNAGSHTITATYAGGGGFAGDSDSKLYTVSKADTSIDLTSSPNPSAPNQSVTFTAKVSPVAPGSGSPPGTIQFNIDGTDYGTPVNLSGGSANSTPKSDLTVGTHTIKATYNNTGNNFNNSVATMTQTVGGKYARSYSEGTFTENNLNTACAVDGSGNSVESDGTYASAYTSKLQDKYGVYGNFGFNIPTSATITGVQITIAAHSNEGADMSALNYDISLSTDGGGTFVNNIPTDSIYPLSANSGVDIISSKGGDLITWGLTSPPLTPAIVNSNNFRVRLFSNLTDGPPATLYLDYVMANVSYTLAETNTELSSSASQWASVGQPVTFTATVSPKQSGTGTPSGTVTFKNGSIEIGTVSLDGSGQAKCTTSFVTSGGYSIYATYNGNSDFKSSTGNLTQQVTTLAITTSSPLPAATVGIAYSKQLVASGGNEIYSWGVSAGSIPGFGSIGNTNGIISGTPTTAGTYNITIYVISNSTTITKDFSITINKGDAVITWANPANITYSTALSGTQLNATASKPGSFVYTPAAGTILNASNGQSLTVDFTPDDAANYNTATKTVTINVLKADQTLTWIDPADITYGTPLSETQLNAIVSVSGPDPAGALTYNPVAGTILDAVSSQALSVTAAATANYNEANKTVYINVNKADQTINWSDPAPITYGTALSEVQLNATVTVPGTSPAGALTYDPTAGTVLNAGTQLLKVTAAATDNYNQATKDVHIVVGQATPKITWSNPADIVYGKTLSETQLNATADVEGTFAYTPPADTKLNAGDNQTLSVTFTPTDSGNYTDASAEVKINVLKATPAITWTNPADITYGTALSETQLNATADVEGTFAYTPNAGTKLNAGNNQTLSVTFTPTDSGNYAPASAEVKINVLKATPAITWANPSAITYGTPLSETQLNATSDVKGTFTYDPKASITLDAGSRTLSVSFTPEDNANYNGASKDVTLIVNKATAEITWPDPAAIVYGTALSDAELNATANVPGQLIYNPEAGLVLDAGSHTLSVSLTPDNPDNYDAATKSVMINVNKADQTINWSDPAPITYGTALSEVQLNATITVPGTSPAGALTYDPTAGTVLNAGTQLLKVTAAATDNYNQATKDVHIVVGQATPKITWANPADIVYGTALSAVQLNASANVEGTFAYTPNAGTKLNAGDNQTLSVTFTPTDSGNYAPASAEVKINVLKATPVITWSNPADITYPETLGDVQLGATASVSGTFTYIPPSGTLLNVGPHTLSVSFTPEDANNYQNASRQVTINVLKGTLIVTWPNPADIVYGTALSENQLDASASIPGTFVYTPDAGSILEAGNGQTLSALFTPNDTLNYDPVTKTAIINVNKADQTITWSDPAPITYGTALSEVHLNATVTVPGASPAGALTFDPPAGTKLNASSHQALKVTAAETANYNSASATVYINVNKADQTINWSDPAPITYGTALSEVQLNATITVPGTSPAGALTYDPVAGAVLNAGTHPLTVTAAATDNYNSATKIVNINVGQATPTVTWSNPADIVYGTALSNTQLNATASISGGFAYTPAIGTVLDAGDAQTLSVIFTPADSVDYTTATASVKINVTKANPVITWSNPADITYPTPLSGTQLNATASVPGILTYTPAAGTVLGGGNGQTLSVSFDATDSHNYNAVSKTVTINVLKGNGQVTFTLPFFVYVADGTAKTASATTNPAGLHLNYTYNGSSTAPIAEGTYNVVATIDDVNYQGSASCTLAIYPPLSISTASPLPNGVFDKAYSMQLSASGGGNPSSYVYSITSGNLPPGLTLTPGGLISGTPTQAGAYSFVAKVTDSYNITASRNLSLTVDKADLTISWNYPADIVYGTALNATQLNAAVTLNGHPVAGNPVYTPAAGTILSAGPHILNVLFTPAEPNNCNNAVAQVVILVSKASATITLGNLLNVYDGNPKPASYTTTPPGLGVSITYKQGDITVDVPIQEGSYNVNAVITDSNYIGSQTGILIIYPSITITTGSLPAGTYNTAYSQSLTVDQGKAPYVWTVASGNLPDGLTLNPNTGIISGTPTRPTADAYAFTVKVQDTYGAFTTRALSIKINKASPIISWNNPADIVYGTALSIAQLNATASVPGIFAYTPASDTILNAGAGQTLHAEFTPTEAANYNNVSSDVIINVSKADTGISWAKPADITYGALLSSTQLNATTSVQGTFAYTPAAGEKLNAGDGQTLSATFTPTDAANYNSATVSTKINVQKSTVTFTLTGLDWTYDGSAKSATVTPNPAGPSYSLTYNGSATAPKDAGSYTVAVTNTDANYTGSASGTLTIAKVPLTVTADNASRVYGAPNPTFTATISGFIPGENSSVVNGTAAMATAAAPASPVGPYDITVAQGSLSAANYTFTTFNKGILTINKADAILSLTSNINPSVAGQPVTLTATVSAASPATGNPGSSVSFYNNDVYLGAANVVGGQATLTTTQLAVGHNTLRAEYSGDLSYNPSSSLTYTQNVNPPALKIDTVALPNGIVGTAYSQTLAESGGIGPFTWTYTGNLPAGITFDSSTGVISGTPTLAGSNDLMFKVTDSTSNFAAKDLPVSIDKGTPVITWANPASISYGTTLSSTQLNATANVPGTFAYSPAAEAKLTFGSHSLSVTFTPDAANNYNIVTKVVTINVTQGNVAITWTNPADIYYGTALSGTQLNASTSVPGNFVYNPPSGTFLTAGSNQTLQATFTPTDAVNYNVTAVEVKINVLKANPVITWSNPADITFPTALSNTQLNAFISFNSDTIPGTLVYNPVSGTILNAGNNQTLTANFTPTDLANFNPVVATVKINVLKTTPMINWPKPADITYPTPLSGTQLNATASVPGSFLYAPAAGTVLNVGNNHSLSVVFTPGDTANYNGTTASTTINVLNNKADITFGNLNQTYDGNPKPVTVTTNPGGLSYNLTYNGSTTAPKDAGSYAVVATISDPNYSGTASDTLVISKAVATVNLSSPSYTYDGTAKTATATTTPTGLNVSITYNNSATAPANAGTYALVATINDPNYSGSSNGTLTINKVNLTVTANNANRNYGAANPTFTASFSGFIGGDNSSVVSGTPTFTTTATNTSPAGTYPITPALGSLSATNYNFTNFVNGTLTIGQTNTSITVTSNPNPSTIATAVTFTATVTGSGGSPTGTVNFRNNGSLLGSSILASGQATFAYTFTGQGDNQITAEYGGDANFVSSTSTALTQIVYATALQITNTSLASGTVSVFYSQTLTETGGFDPCTWSITGGSLPAGLNLDASTGIISGTPTTAGTSNPTFTVKDAKNVTASQSLSITIAAASSRTTTTVVTSSYNPSVYGQTVRFTATVINPKKTPSSGNVTFKDGNIILGTASVNRSGISSFDTSKLSVGTHSITATFSGNTSFDKSTSAPLIQTVNKAATATAIRSSSNPSRFGRLVTFTATVSAKSPGSGTPTGTVTFMDGNNTFLFTASLKSGVASFSSSSLTRGTHSIKVIYSGDNNYNGSTSTVLSQVVN
jgi:hypothetical protein